MWIQHDNLLTYKISQTSLSPVIKLASFDLDSTLILSNSGEKYATVKGWVFAFDKIPEILKVLYDSGYTIVIFSNRSSPTYGMKTCQKTIESIELKSKVPINAFLSTKDSLYRKPEIGMLKFFMNLFNIKQLHRDSFFCGDAVGAESKYPENRWKDSDKMFAINAGLNFYEPQEIFHPFTQSRLDPHIRLLITVGPTGWEELPKYTDTPIYDGRRFSVNYIPHRYIEGEVQIVIGKHPTKYERDQILNIVGAFPHQVQYLYYCNLQGKEMDKEYVRDFEKLTENIIRMT